MQATLFPETLGDARQAYVVRGVDLVWYAKRQIDGVVIAQDAEKIEAIHKAENLGFYFTVEGVK